MKIPINHIIHTENLLLRIPVKEDIPHIFSAAHHKGFTDGMLWEPPEQESELETTLTFTHNAWKEGSGYSFTILDIHTSDFLGRVSIRGTKEADVLNIGFWTHPRHQGKGIMTEAVAAILRLGFEKLGAQSIEAEYATWNKASERVLEKNGLSFIKYIEKGFQKNGAWVAENRYRITKGEWKKLENG